jgi:hypothetical protein
LNWKKLKYYLFAWATKYSSDVDPLFMLLMAGYTSKWIRQWIHFGLLQTRKHSADTLPDTLKGHKKTRRSGLI